MSKISYNQGRANEKQILSHLEKCSGEFIPPLAERVDLEKYANKLSQKSKNFEAWEGDRLVGLVAAYFDSAKPSAFITNVSIDLAFRGQGVAKRLLEDCYQEATKAGFKAVTLEVSSRNSAAIRLYEGMGYSNTGKKDDTIHMEIKCNQ